MRSTSSSLWQRRLFSATVRAAAVSTFRGGHNGLSQFFFPPVAAEHQGFFSWQQHSRLFSTSTSDIDSMVSSASENDGKYTDYEKWVRRLYMTNMFHPVKMGLTNMKKLHDLMSNPMDDVRIAGSAQENQMGIFWILHSHLLDGLSLTD